MTDSNYLSSYEEPRRIKGRRSYICRREGNDMRREPGSDGRVSVSRPGSLVELGVATEASVRFDVCRTNPVAGMTLLTGSSV